VPTVEGFSTTNLVKKMAAQTIDQVTGITDQVI
jgi:hypothetical protein